MIALQDIQLHALLHRLLLLLMCCCMGLLQGVILHLLQDRIIRNISFSIPQKQLTQFQPTKEVFIFQVAAICNGLLPSTYPIVFRLAFGWIFLALAIY
ncbi:unnamed protein product [Blepharisma stoltei]|uniref:Uncharacterized protein n=1 Tax=Blepharisma stoltei TaxID=1481888 RepID=A0AAU9KD02_9CILI|nr:unnamed protein product [Blepharisma stoltei]